LPLAPDATAYDASGVDLYDMFLNGHLDDRFPLPLDQPFTAQTAYAAGIGRRQLGALTGYGFLRRPIRGVYVPTTVPDSLSLRAAVLRLVTPPDCVIVDRHAGWLHGAEMILAPGEQLALRPLSMFRPSGRGRLRNGISRSGERWLRQEDVVEVEGLRVTTPLRTAWDLGRVRWADEAISGLDMMLRLGAFGRDELLDGVEQFRGQRWITTLRNVAPLADGRSESPGESVLRLRCIEVRLPVTPQVEVRRSGLLIARVDLGNLFLKTAVEYDGEEWHSSPEQLRHDRLRRRDLVEDDWLVGAFTKSEVFNPRRPADFMLARLREEALRRRRAA
jgi:hypothetical protein